MAIENEVVAMDASLKTMTEMLPEDGRMMPAFFIGHGTPMNEIEDNAFVRGWKKAMADIPKPTAILCVGALAHARDVGDRHGASQDDS